MNNYFWVAEIRDGDVASGVIEATCAKEAHAAVTKKLNGNSWHEYTVVRLERIE